MSQQFRFVGRTAETLGNGRPVAPGEQVALEAKDQTNEQNARLIREGKLLALPDDAPAVEHLQALSDDDINTLAGKVGVEDVDELADFDAVVAAIAALAEPSLGDLGRDDLNVIAQIKGVSTPEQLQNKQAVVDAITATTSRSERHEEAI